MNKDIILDIHNRRISRYGYNFAYCLDDCIATISGYEKNDYCGMYLNESVDVCIDTIKKRRKILEAIHIDSNIMENLYKYHGLKLKQINKESNEELLNIIVKQINENKTVIVHLDGFYYEWDVDYNKRHNLHLALVKGISNDEIIITDPFYERMNEKIKLTKFINHCGFCYLYEKINVNNDFSFESQNMMIKDNHEKVISFIKKLIWSFDNVYNRKIEFEEANSFDNLQNTFLSIAASRGRFFNLLSYMYSIRGIDSKKEYTIMERVLQYWIIVKNMLVKDLLTKKYDIRRAIKDKLERIVILEEELFASSLEKISLNKINISVPNTIYPKLYDEINWKKINCLVLEEYLNNKAFGKRGGQADFTGVGEFLMENHKNLSEIKQTRFNTYIGKKEFVFDNIVCEGQKVKIEYAEKINILSFLVTSEFGESFDTIKLYCDDNIINELYLQVSDISMFPIYEEMIAWEGESYYYKKVKDEYIDEKHLDKAYIFMLTYCLDEKKKIDVIELPNCQNIHLFAISVGNGEIITNKM